MSGSINNRIVGKCSLCGGVVSVPKYYMSTKRPVPECEDCGAYADETAHLPTIPMKPREPKPKLKPAQTRKKRTVADPTQPDGAESTTWEPIYWRRRTGQLEGPQLSQETLELWGFPNPEEVT